MLYKMSKIKNGSGFSGSLVINVRISVEFCYKSEISIKISEMDLCALHVSVSCHVTSRSAKDFQWVPLCQELTGVLLVCICLWTCIVCFF